MAENRKLSTSLSTISDDGDLAGFPYDVTRKRANGEKLEKMRRILNSFYSIMTGITGSILSKRYSSHYKLIGFLLFVITYVFNVALLKQGKDSYPE